MRAKATGVAALVLILAAAPACAQQPDKLYRIMEATYFIGSIYDASISVVMQGSPRYSEANPLWHWACGRDKNGRPVFNTRTWVISSAATVGVIALARKIHKRDRRVARALMFGLIVGTYYTGVYKNTRLCLKFGIGKK